MKIFFYVLTVISLLISGCLESNNELIKTTFERSFNKEIISSYLTSNDPAKIKAALLSTSHSEDTSFVPLIISMPFEKYAQLICFSIGQIGPCFSSTKFLWERSKTEQMAGNSRFIFEAIGKTGDEQDLDKITDMYSNYDGPTFPYSGISLALRQFSFRSITSERAKQILLEEVTNPINSVQNKNDALFTLARTESSDQINDELKRIISAPKTNNPDTIKLKQYSLMNFRTQKYFPNDEIIVKSILSETNLLLRIEAARSLSFRMLNSLQDVDQYLKLLKDENPNVSRAAARSIVNLSLSSDELKDYLKSHVQAIIYSNLPPHTLGELLISMVVVFDYNVIDEYVNLFTDNRIPLNYYYDALGYNNSNEQNLELLIEDFRSEISLKDEISLLSKLLKFQTTFPENVELQNILLRSLSSGSVPLVSISADGIDSLFIVKNSEKLKTIILRQLADERNNPDFAEGIIFLLNLAEKIDSVFYSEVTDMAIESTVYSVRKFVSEKKGLNVTGEKPSEHLDEILDNSFSYKTAEIQTNKGNFIIEFLPQYAPVSVGNFCTLAKKSFFNDVEFHRVVPGFVIQVGDTTSTGWGGPGYEIISETSPLNYDVGLVGMASAGKDTEGSQWFVMQGSYPHLNGRYSIFANVLNGMEVVYNIDQNDKILQIKLYH
ncbi:peptidylprolyl isomerase [Bacteroidota bacterium]